MLGGSFIRHAIDMIGVFIQVERRLFLCVIPGFGASHGWSVVTSTVCSSAQLFFLLITWSSAKILLDFSFASGHQVLHDQGELR